MVECLYMRSCMLLRKLRRSRVRIDAIVDRLDILFGDLFDYCYNEMSVKSISDVALSILRTVQFLEWL